MSGYTLTPSAGADLAEIAEYTLEVWGAAQLDRYMGGLETVLHRLAERPELGRRRSDLGIKGLRSFRHRSHMIYFRQALDKIEVLRVLHVARDAWSILG